MEALAAAEVVGGFIRHNRDPGDEDQQALQEELDAARQARSRRIHPPLLRGGVLMGANDRDPMFPLTPEDMEELATGCYQREPVESLTNRDPGDEDQQALQEELDAARQARYRLLDAVSVSPDAFARRRQALDVCERQITDLEQALAEKRAS